MKNLVIKFAFIVFSLFNIAASACDACKLQQPKITKNLAHGVGPESMWDYVIVAIVAIATVMMFILSLKYLINPKEKNKNHIKYSIFSNQNYQS